jgi:hypothetical protein
MINDRGESMDKNDVGMKDKDIILFFEKQLSRRKKLPNKILWLTDLKDIYEALIPYLPVSDPAKRYIHKIIKDAQ